MLLLFFPRLMTRERLVLRWISAQGCPSRNTTLVLARKSPQPRYALPLISHKLAIEIRTLWTSPTTCCGPAHNPPGCTKLAVKLFEKAGGFRAMFNSKLVHEMKPVSYRWIHMCCELQHREISHTPAMVASGSRACKLLSFFLSFRAAARRKGREGG